MHRLTCSAASTFSLLGLVWADRGMGALNSIGLSAL